MPEEIEVIPEDKVVVIIGSNNGSLSPAEIEAGYNSQVPLVSQADAEAGIQTDVRRWNALRVAQAIAALAGGGGAGDMLVAIYDPTAVGADAFAMDNMAEGANTKILTAAERDKITFISITAPVDLDQLKADVEALSAVVTLKGVWDASVGTFPGGGAAQTGHSYIVSTGGVVDGIEFNNNDRIVAIADNAADDTYAANWHKLDYTDAVLSVDGVTGAIDIATILAAKAQKSSPIDADKIPYLDSTAGDALKWMTLANLGAYTRQIPADQQIFFGNDLGADNDCYLVYFSSINELRLVNFIPGGSTRIFGDNGVELDAGNGDVTLEGLNGLFWLFDILLTQFAFVRTQNEVAAHLVAIEADGSVCQFPVRRLITNNFASGKINLSFYANHYDGWLIEIIAGTGTLIERMTERNGTLANHTDVPDGDIRWFIWTVEGEIAHGSGPLLISGQDYWPFDLLDKVNYKALIGDIQGFIKYNEKWIEIVRTRREDQFVFEAGEALAANDICYLHTDGKMYKAIANDEAKSTGILMFSVSAVAAASNGLFQSGGILTTAGLTTGSKYFLDAVTAGIITDTMPTDSGDVQRIIGYAIAATQLMVSIDHSYSIEA